ncbi:hypothetical protein QNO07_15130 [Streptomyces sp. 549]|uniref:hypothetical protein n=1 Tax=Streptomyces sp. 549 TaxID=3049076 RepID=UPI0024C42E1F|nr:hypothetical protein [Streptomyces sp. 549]MDK1474739.1 hypothetical protein [Streptomyces sp. 549]
MHAAPRPGRPRPAPALELLVHGVGGATPHDMLDDPRTVRVTGDGTAGIHRRADDADAEERADGHPAQPVPEAYCWSNLTSGNGARALWLILLPFMIANLAYWMRPAAPRAHPAQRLYSVLVRLIALSLTVLLVAAACEVALDLVAWQCAGAAGCARNTSWLAFLAADGDGWWSTPGRRLVVASLLPVLLTALLWGLSRRTWSAYESAPPPPLAPAAARVPAVEDRPPLSLPGFWYGRRLVGRLRAAHTSAGLLTVASAVQFAVAGYDRRLGGWPEDAGRLLAAATALCWCLTVFVVVHRGRSEEHPDDRSDRAATQALPWAAVGLLALTAVHAAWDRPGWTSTEHLPGTAFFAVCAVVQGLLIAALAAVALLLHRRAPAGHRSVLHGLGGAAVALLACALGGVLSGGVAQRVAEWLAPASSEGAGAGLIAGPPVVLTWQAAVIPLLVVAVALFALVSAARVWRARRRLIPEVMTGYPEEDPEREVPSRTERIAGTVARASLTDSAPALVGSVAVLTLLLGAGAVLGAVLSGLPPGQAAGGAPGPLPALGQLAQGIGSWLMGALVIVLITTGRRAYRDAGARRTIGILWDVGTFWPRAAHPFAPPCYAERAVPDLSWRISSWTELTGGRLVLSGHSQGSVLAAAAVWQLDPVTRNRVALLTYGSPLERLYGRWFPACFGPTALRALHREVDCWRNLWRATDPIGGPVRVPGGGGPDVDCGPLKDPLQYGRSLRHPLHAPILGHGDYQLDPAFGAERRDLLVRLTERDDRVVPTQPAGPRLPSGNDRLPSGNDVGEVSAAPVPAPADATDSQGAIDTTGGRGGPVSADPADPPRTAG